MYNQISTVEEALERYKEAVNEQDVEKFLSSYSSDIHIYDCWGSWECKGENAWRENVTEWFSSLKEEGVKLQTVFNDLVIEEGESTAFSHCALTFVAYNVEKEEKLRQITNRFTFGFKKEKGSWVITHEHSSLPIDMKNGKGMFNLR
ncbi:YybH family protein [Guptibacillus spartinae]|uniref:YybH family protein n=1 Tax=Guptibacillus spartinae TaxID=3025679 RepID=UPI00236196A2|nr:nuclear transport factor 2 family protein [Pseudalkalibacillus spartinae]